MNIYIDNSPVIKKLDSGIRFILYVLIFWLPYSKAVIETSVILGLIVWGIKRSLLVQQFLRKHSWDKADKKEMARIFLPRKNFLNTPIFIFFLIGVVSICTSATVLECLWGFSTKILEWFVIYFLVIEVFTEKKYIWIAFGIFLFTSISTVLDSLIQFYWTHKDFFFGYMVTDNRATGSFNHSNDLAGYLTFVAPLSMVLFFLKKKSLLKFLLAIAMTGLSLWSLFVTFSRGAWLAVIGGILLFLFLVVKNRKPFLILVTVSLVFCAGIFFTSNKKEFRLDAREVQDTVHWRSTLWEDSIKMILNRPNFGYGPNTFMSTFVDFGRSIRGGGYYSPTYVHNCFIQLAAEIGLWGLASFLGIIGLLIQKMIVQIQRPQSADYNLKILSSGMLCGTVAFLGHSFVDTNLFSLQLSALFWLMIGLQVSIYMVQMER